MRPSVATRQSLLMGDSQWLEPLGWNRVGWNRPTSRAPLPIEEPHDVLRNLREAGDYRLRSGLFEHVTHVLHQDQLGTCTGCLQVSIEFGRLRLQDLRVVYTLDNEDRSRGPTSPDMSRGGRVGGSCQIDSWGSPGRSENRSRLTTGFGQCFA